jgi:hypothetical protein
MDSCRQDRRFGDIPKSLDVFGCLWTSLEIFGCVLDVFWMCPADTNIVSHVCLGERTG